MRDSRKKISKTDSLIVWDIDGKIVKKSLSERLAEEPKITLDDAKVELYLADKYGIAEEVFKNFKLFLTGGDGNLLRSGTMGYIGNHPQLQKLEKIEQEKLKLKKKEIAQRDKLIELDERKIKLAEQGKLDKDSLVGELCNIIKAMHVNAHVQPSKGKKKIKKAALGELRNIYPKWCGKNLQFDPKLPTKKNKEYYRTDVLPEVGKKRRVWLLERQS